MLSEQNPHWFAEWTAGGIRRELLDLIRRELDVDHVIAISGIRRCGKSFLLKQIMGELLKANVPADNLLFMNLEQALYTGMQSNEILDKLLAEYRRLRNPQGRIYLFLDEIQTLENWEIWVKYEYDLHKGRIKFFISGSNSRLLSSEFATHLTGRVIEHRLTPFSFREYLIFRDFDPGKEAEWIVKRERILHYFGEYMQRGGMPEGLTAQYRDTARTLLMGTFDSVIYKDIVPRFGIRQSETLRKLGLYLIGQSGNISNLNKIGTMLGTNRNQVREYIGYLESALLIHVLPKFEYSERKQFLSQKKVYVCDNGFISDLAFQFSADRGDLLENVVLSELLRRRFRVYYYKNQAECDFIVYDYGREQASYQVCVELTPENRQREFRGLLAGCREIKINSGTILTWNQEEQLEQNGTQISVIPVWKWLLQLDYGQPTHEKWMDLPINQ